MQIQNQVNEQQSRLENQREEQRRGQSLGFVRTDAGAPGNTSLQIVVSGEGSPHFRRDLYVGLHDREQDLEFLGRVVAGPFYLEGRPGAAAEGAPDYTIEGTIEILGQLTADGRTRPTATRPQPGSEVYTFPDGRLQRLLGMAGDFYIGHLIGYDHVAVCAQSKDKGFLPRNVGVFGTVGSGKSNTTQVIMEEALRAGWAVVVVDVEGEYVRMNEPTDDQALIRLLEQDHDLAPAGVGACRVYEPASGNSEAAAAQPFKVPISAMEPGVVADILDFTEGQARMYEAVTRNATSRNEYIHRQSQGPAGAASRSLPPALQPSTPQRPRAAYGALQGTAAPPSPAPRSPDGPVGATAEAAEEASTGTQRTFTLQDLIDGLQESNQSIPLMPRIRPEDLPTASTLRSKLVHLAQADVLDTNATTDVPELPIEDLIVAGRLSVLDVSETEDRSRNITIAYTLQALFEKVIQTPLGKPMPSGQARPPLLVVIEEVHNFVSRATAHRMRAVLDSLQIISRRGRKRWMALALVSQQPNHVPDELFELANTRFIHQMKAVSNLDAVKQTTGGVHEALWSSVPVLGTGRSLVSGAVFKNPIFVDVRPAQSRRLFVH